MLRADALGFGEEDVSTSRGDTTRPEGDAFIGGVTVALLLAIIGIGEEAGLRGLIVASRSPSPRGLFRGAFGSGLGRMRELPPSDISALRGLVAGLTAAERESIFEMFPFTIERGLLGRLRLLDF